jgi:hypothetical protein
VGEPHRRERRRWLLLPALPGVRGYRRAWVRGDLLAGATVAAFLVPQVMAYAQVAGVPPAAGLWVSPLAMAGTPGSTLRGPVAACFCGWRCTLHRPDATSGGYHHHGARQAQDPRGAPAICQSSLPCPAGTAIPARMALNRD